MGPNRRWFGFRNTSTFANDPLLYSGIECLPALSEEFHCSHSKRAGDKREFQIRVWLRWSGSLAEDGECVPIRIASNGRSPQRHARNAVGKHNCGGLKVSA